MEIEDYDNPMEEKTATDIIVAEVLFKFIWVTDGESCALVHPESKLLEKYSQGKTEKFFPDAFRYVPPFSSSPLYLHDLMYEVANNDLDVSLHTDNSLMSLLYNALVYDPRDLSQKRKIYQSGSTPQETVSLAILDFYGKAEEALALEEKLKERV